MQFKCRLIAFLVPLIASILPSFVAEAATDVPQRGGAITWGVTTEPVCFDPHRSSQQNAFFVIRNYIDSLTAKSADGSFVPWLAKSWSISPDGKTYTFLLRDDVTFHDGTKFDAEAVKTNLDYVKNPVNTATAASFLLYYDHAEVVSPTEVKIVLSQPDSTFLESTSSVKLGIVSPKSLARDDGLCNGGPELAGTGPFVFERYVRGQSVSFVRNAAYHWGPGYAQHEGPAWLDRVTFRFLPEYAVRAGALSSGQLDLIEGVQPVDIDLFRDQPGFNFLLGPSGASTSFTLNINYTRPPADDVRVRRALRDGADLDAIVKSVYRGTVPRAWSIIGPQSSAYNKALVGSWGNDPKAANALLDEAGWTGRDAQGFRTKDGKRLTIEVGYPQPYVRDNRDVLIQGVQAALRKSIGLDLSLKIITAGEFAKQTAEGTWTIYPNTDNPSDPAKELWDMLGAEGFLYVGLPSVSDQEITGLIRKALQSIDPHEKQDLVHQIQKRAVDQAYIVPLFAPRYQLASKAIVHGLGFEPQLDGPSSAYEFWLSK